MSRVNGFPLRKRPQLLLTLAVLIAVSCTPNTRPGTRATSTAKTPPPTELHVACKEFDFAPKRFTVAAGQPLTLVLDNSQGNVEHDFTIDELGLRLQAKAGATTKTSHVFDKPGTYPFKCSLPGHKELGMAGSVQVLAAGPAGQTPPAGTTAAREAATDTREAPGAASPNLAELAPLPAVEAAPPVSRRHPDLVRVELEAKPVTALINEGVAYTYWTFNGTVPGPMIRVRQGDTVELTLKNSLASPVTHSIDSHGVTGPGGGAKVTQTPPGGRSRFRFKALKPGAYVYHCASPMIPHHISRGMYGLMVVEPAQGWPKVDREYYVMQGDFYLTGDPTKPGLHELDAGKLTAEHPDYVLFNGGVGALSKENALKANVGETVRIFFGLGGPNTTSSFHVIGEIFDRVNPEAGAEFVRDVQTTLVPAGGAAIVEFKLDVPGSYILVDHSLGRLQKGAAGFLTVEGEPNSDVFQPLETGMTADSGH
jgi:nitrite reductase (NO-forming)